MPAAYHSETTNWSSEPRNGDIYGTHNVVNITDGKGYKIQTQLNKQCKPRKTVKKALTKYEINAVTKGTFLPGFWSHVKSVRGKKNRSRHMRQNEGKRLYK